MKHEILQCQIKLGCHIDQPETFLRRIVAEVRNDAYPQIVGLEQILSQLLDQDIANIDLILFFDALDEFD